ncbi:MGDG synthase family glycosyltransferase [Fervidibacillus halotolerans]|uniref:Uncharacterized protein n=1 Tax=Fervidibacillus halotolerans TaxID=2980027 RepID=A0A9E8M1M7_9BACI|nr:glycosyltransferase [Fervidibacillus halotolerans]WAA13312.1 hypothetical protein OE105_04095 [Fervidibacillus halotolerans]
MKKILLLPFLQIPTGHHQAAEAIMAEIQRYNPTFQCEKIDIFSFSYKHLETWSSTVYLRWIHTFPNTYSKIYNHMVISRQVKNEESYFYELFFRKQMEKLIHLKKPDGIVCTHALPSLLLSKLKIAGKIDIPIFNVYTDFFIHKGWGVKGIDGHFVSTENMKKYLIKKGVKEENIFLTGIPIHPEIRKNPVIPEHPKGKGNILLSGGSMGAGKIIHFMKTIKKDDRLHYYILCGRNSKLFHKLLQMNKKHITPIGYIPSRKMMDLIYNQMDLLLTKPGGLTVTEAFIKKIPTFIYYALPGQEEFNLRELKALQLVLDFTHPANQKVLQEKLVEFLQSPSTYSQYFSKLAHYEKKKLPFSPGKLIAHHLIQSSFYK